MTFLLSRVKVTGVSSTGAVAHHSSTSDAAPPAPALGAPAAPAVMPAPPASTPPPLAPTPPPPLPVSVPTKPAWPPNPPSSAPHLAPMSTLGSQAASSAGIPPNMRKGLALNDTAVVPRIMDLGAPNLSGSGGGAPSRLQRIDPNCRLA